MDENGETQDIECEEGEIVDQIYELSDISSLSEEEDEISNKEMNSLKRKIMQFEATNKELELIENLSMGNYGFYYDNTSGKENKYKHFVMSKRKPEQQQQQQQPVSHKNAKKSKKVPPKKAPPNFFRDRRSASVSRKIKPNLYRRFNRNHDAGHLQSINKRKKLPRKRNRFRSAKKPPPSASVREGETIDLASSSSDEEILALRLQALKSKQEVKEIIGTQEPENIVSEEQELRLIALKSAFLKKSEARKKKKLDNDRPYSPSDAIPLLNLEDEFDCDVSNMSTLNNEEDSNDRMDISPKLDNSEIILDKTVSPETASIDMEISDDSNLPVNSPVVVIEANPKEQLLEEPIIITTSDDLKNILLETKSEEEAEEAEALRSLLLSSRPSNTKKCQNSNEEETVNNDLPELEKNLKKAVERLKRKQQIDEILDTHNSNKYLIVETPPSSNDQCIPIIVGETPNVITVNTVPEIPTPSQPADEITQLANAKKRIISKKRKKSVTQRIIKPIPLKPNVRIEQEAAKDNVPKVIVPEPEIPKVMPSKELPKEVPKELKPVKQNRLITSLEDSSIQPVKQLIINLQSESESDHENLNEIVVNTTAVVSATDWTDIQRLDNQSPCHVIMNEEATPDIPNNFDKNLDDFLKSIRAKQTAISVSIKDTPQKTKASVRHLPLSSQIEYENLVKKMKLLEAQKTRKTLKRSMSSGNEKMGLKVTTKVATSSPQKRTVEVQRRQNQNQNEKRLKISEHLEKISCLDDDAKERLVKKSEANYQNQSSELLSGINNLIEVLNTVESDVETKDKLEKRILRTEQILAALKSKLKENEKKIGETVPKVETIQKELLQRKSKHNRFRTICQQVGKTVMEDYRLPNNFSTEINDSTKLLLNKTSELLSKGKIFSTTCQIKALNERIRVFFVNNDKETAVIPKKVEATEVKEVPKSVEIVVEETNAEIPDVAKDGPGEDKEEEVLESVEQKPKEVSKKTKYESPLEYKNQKSLNNLNTTICPFLLTGSCQDKDCQFEHL